MFAKERVHFIHPDHADMSHLRHHEYGQQLNSILEKNICQSDCIDLESLCIQAREYVRVFD